MTRVRTRPTCDCYNSEDEIEDHDLKLMWNEYLFNFCPRCGAPAEEVDKMGDIKCPECNSTNYTIVYDDITRVATESCLNCGLNRVVHDPRGQSTGKEGGSV